MFLLDGVPVWNWLKDGGLLAVIVVLIIVLYQLLNMYKAKDKRLDVLQKETQDHEEALLTEQRDRFQKVIDEKETRIQACEDRNRALGVEFRQEINRLLAESIEARNETANSMRDQSQSFKDTVERLIQMLKDS